MATVYHRDDAGAPVLSYGAGGAVGFVAFKAILKACLVNGYGSKPSAGWELITEDTNYLVLRNGNHTGYVCFTWLTGTNYVTIYLAETYSGVVNSVMQGAGLKTGIASSNSAPHRFYVSMFANSSVGGTWFMVADAKTFVLCAPSNGGSPGTVQSTGVGDYGLMLYVGEDSSGYFIAMGGINSSSDANPITNFSGLNGFTSLRNPATGLLVDGGSLVVYTPGFESFTPHYSVVLTLVELALVPGFWCGGGVQAGRLRGIAMHPQLSRMWASHAAQSIGFSGALTTRNANTPIGLGDGYTYFATIKFSGSPFFLMTDNPEFW